MKKTILSCILLQACFAFGQTIPNSYFEGWNSKNTDVIKNWEVFGKSSKIVGKSGGSALHLANNASTGRASYAFQANLDTNSLFLRGPAFAFNGTPDSVMVTYRAALQSDTSYLEFSFTKKGELFPLTYNSYELTGTAGAWKTVVLPVSYINFTDSLIADSGWIYIQSADDIDGPYSNGFIDIDAISFIYKNHTTVSAVPNENFDNWDSYLVEMADNWGSAALFLKNGGQHFNFTNKTTDKHSGDYAIKLQAFEQTDPRYLLNDTFPGFAITMRDAGNADYSDADINTPGFAVNQRFQSIRGFVKSDLKSADLTVIMVNFFKADTVVGSAVFSDTTGHAGWFEFSEDIAWDSSFSGSPDSATVLMMVCDSMLQNVGSMNSWAIIDDLKFDNFSAGNLRLRPNELRATVYPNPTNGNFQLKFTASIAGPAEISIRNAQGQLVQKIQKEISQGTTLLPLSISELPAGIYMVGLQTAEGSFTQKILLNP